MSELPTDPASRAGRRLNRLAGETSPYLLQHAANPVDWYPWGEEAIAQARALNRPIFLSIGYSACHWCHVMERESFESPAIAALMNEHFINIKVDREERPDLDQIYMSAVTAMTGHGGWPMSVFLTPDLEPFFGGTYFPPRDSRGIPGFPRVLEGVDRAWRERREEILESARAMTEQLRSLSRAPGSPGKLDPAWVTAAARVLLRVLDPVHGGFGRAPKFPHPMDLRVLLRAYARGQQPAFLNAVTLTLDKMSQGGIHDHLGGGFARYSTDERWLVPHFEKMLYDNALLASTYLEAYQATRQPRFAAIARSTLDYLLGRMRSPEGAFHATEDADSEGVEGKFYVWSADEVRSVLGPAAAATFCQVYDVSERGNWEEANILNLPRSIDEVARDLGRDPETLALELLESRRKLLAHRERRIPPELDAKILASWNGLAIAAFAESGRILGNLGDLEAARAAADFILTRMRQPDGRLWHAYKDGRARFNACLDDYACVIDGLARLFESTGEARLLEQARALAEIMIREFEDERNGGFFYTPVSHENLIARPKDVHDNATPSGNGMAATALARLGRLLAHDSFTRTAKRALEAVAHVLEHEPTAAGQSLIALDFLEGEGLDLAVVAGSDAAEFHGALEKIARRFMPGRVVVPRPGGASDQASPLLAERPARGDRVTTYLCKGSTCGPPVVGLDELEAALP